MYQPVIDHGGASPSFAQNIEVVQYEYMKRGKEFPVVMIPEKYLKMSRAKLHMHYTNKLFS